VRNRRLALTGIPCEILAFSPCRKSGSRQL